MANSKQSFNPSANMLNLHFVQKNMPQAPRSHSRKRYTTQRPVWDLESTSQPTMVGAPQIVQVLDDKVKDETIDEDDDVHELQIDIKNNVP